MAHAAEELGILEALDDPELFLQLNDHIVDAIERSPSEVCVGGWGCRMRVGVGVGVL